LPSNGVKLTKFTHACVRLESDGHAVVIDPGIWTEPGALAHADAILVTHEHTDHIDADALTSLGVPVFAPSTAKINLPTLRAVDAGETFDAAGFRIRAVGGRHAITYAGQPACANLGYVINHSLYHPGDAFAAPGESIETLVVPVFGPWMKAREAIDFTRLVQPLRAAAIHDAQLAQGGRESLSGWFTTYCATDFRWLLPGESL
jgi:L-ascorbate metabolism protein UlaG (beta-lactamase superfamily)